MKISKDLERAVRKALAAAVVREAERYDDAVLTIAAEGDDFLAEALTLAHAINSTALFSIHEGRPDDERLEYLVRTFTEQEEEWADIDEGVTRSYLRSLADRTSPLTDVPIADVAFVSFAIGGWLLSAFMPDGESWVDFMDSILDALEALPSDQS